MTCPIRTSGSAALQRIQIVQGRKVNPGQPQHFGFAADLGAHLRLSANACSNTQLKPEPGNFLLTRIAECRAKRRDMPRILVFFLLCLLAAQSAQASAWLREKGSGFVSTAGVLRGPSSAPQYETRIYADYGVLGHLTLGIDLNQKGAVSESSQVSMLSGHARIFMRLPFTPDAWRMRYTLELGTGIYVRDTNLHTEKIERLRMHTVALALGRGFDSPWGPGWLTAQTTVERREALADPIYKLDASIGLSNKRLFRPLLKVAATRVADDPVSWSLTPTILIGSGKKATWAAGLERTFGPNASVGLELGFWREF
ncbi:hypothetical protein [Pontibaca salina]|uniref:Uncharacterized protein n=1 Tax=Pontibaca salina TaxID=2795731 RepID=A0A934HQY8_9RHOB|nr:hypothetical protein [Pontibaca salina]MBI6628583.1 hypothetical protein [Pontibaca salina]